jgi:Protein of unknown function (DUF3305)
MSSVQPLARIAVGVVVERRKAKSAWTDFVWWPAAVLPGEPDAAPWTPLGGDAERMMIYVGGAEVALYRSECENYRANLATGEPKLWTALRTTSADPPLALVAVTADPAEGEAMTESGADLIEALPMPEPVREAIAAFIAEHQVETPPFIKRQRDQADPDALARRPRSHGRK